MVNMDIFQLFFNYLEERSYNNVYQNVKQDADYLEAATKETKLSQQFKKLDLSWILGNVTRQNCQQLDL